MLKPIVTKPILDRLTNWGYYTHTTTNSLINIKNMLAWTQKHRAGKRHMSFSPSLVAIPHIKKFD